MTHAIFRDERSGVASDISPPLAAVAALIARAGLQERARLGEGQPRQARMELPRIAVPEVAEEVRLDVTLREELLLAAEAWLAGGEELLVHLHVIEAGH